MTIVFRSSLFLYLILLTILALIPVAQSGPLFLFSDKILHFLTFLILFFLVDKSFNGAMSWLTLGLLLSYGIILELVQSLTVTRSAEITDLLADFIGLLVYFLFAPRLIDRS